MEPASEIQSLYFILWISFSGRNSNLCEIAIFFLRLPYFHQSFIIANPLVRLVDVAAWTEGL